MRIRNIKSIIFFVTFLMASSWAVAQNQGVHTWHVINAKGAAFNGSLQVINEKATFVRPDGTMFNTFVVMPGQPFKFGFSFDPHADFDVAYTLTLTEKESVKQFVSKTCVFVVTAKGPAVPDVRHFAYNGATCSFAEVKGAGVNFAIE